LLEASGEALSASMALVSLVRLPEPVFNLEKSIMLPF